MIQSPKNPSLLVLFSLAISVLQAQVDAPKRLNFRVEAINHGESLPSLIQDKLSIPESFSLEETSNSKSKAGTHHRYDVRLEGKRVYSAFVHIHVLEGKETGKAVYALPENTDVTESHEFGSIDENAIPSDLSVISMSEIFYEFNGELVPAKLALVKDNYDEVSELVLTTDGILEERAVSVNHMASDTTGTALVFSPNPTTTGHTSYGGNYVDNNDQTNPTLDAERKTVSLSPSFETGLFILKNDAVEITDHSLPTVPPATSSNGSFNYDRSQSGFEDVMVFHHITSMKSHLDNLGYIQVMDYSIPADAHALGGSDNSNFNPSTNPPTLNFGEGGVDDAEDAHVIVHEYGHAIMHSIAPGTNFGSQRQALDEAIGDFFAATYSIKLDDYRWDRTFSWDGHNEFWGGRFTVSNKTYPMDLDFDIYLDAPIWSATLMQLAFNIGLDETDELMLETAYSFFGNMDMSDAAQFMLDADTALNNGVNAAYICHLMADRGLLSACAMDRPDDLITDPLSADKPVFDGHAGLQLFGNPSNSGLHARIIATDSWKLEIYNVLGHSIGIHTGFGNSMLHDPLTNLPNGIYPIRLIQGDHVVTTKLILN